MTQPPVPLWHVFKLALVFFVASVICTGLILLRQPIFGRTSMHYLVWNLFLAWIPFGLAVAASLLWQINSSRRRSIALFSLGWLLFFPNAPYIITDIIHIRKMPAEPIWYDLMVTAAFAWTGFLLGFASLYVMQRLVARIAGWRLGWLFVFRLNSWDVVSAPWAVIKGLGVLIRHPFTHRDSLVFIFITAVFLFLAYVMIYAITHLDRPTTGVQLWRSFLQRRIFR
jgi:uncharacterized membrane protein